MLKTPKKKSANSIKKYFSLVLLVSMVYAVLVATSLVQNRASFESKASDRSKYENDSLVFLATERGFDLNETKLIQLNEGGCCSQLNKQYSKYGLTFENDKELGYGTYQRNGYVVSGDAYITSNSPNEVSATKIKFENPVSKIGLVIMSGNIFSENRMSLAEPLRLRAYDQNGVLLIQQDEIDSCLGKESSCGPIMVGFGSRLSKIGYIEVVMMGDAPYSIGEIYLEE